jgi:hypothetical protein
MTILGLFNYRNGSGISDPEIRSSSGSHDKGHGYAHKKGRSRKSWERPFCKAGVTWISRFF